jgi:predicted site-specific integrase-resolvase
MHFQLVVEGFRLWLSPKEAQQLLACARGTLMAYRDSGKIRTRQTPGGHHRYWRDDILNLVKPS